MNYGTKKKSYIKLSDKFDNVINLKYEDIVADPIKIQLNIKEILKLKSKKKSENINTAVKWDTNNGFDYYQDYYLNEKWKKKLTKADIKFINQYLDKDLMQVLGYELL